MTSVGRVMGNRDRAALYHRLPSRTAMSSTISGTNSPPLEATGEHKPMGKSSVDGGTVHAVPDSEQRKGTHLLQLID